MILDFFDYIFNSCLIKLYNKKMWDSTIKIIRIDDEYALYVPNAFSPNGDGVNETFFAKGVGIKDFKMYIFDRWGNLLYEANNIKPNDKNTAWYGTDKRGKNVDTGVYVYYIEGYCTNNEKVTLTGNISLLR